MNWRIAPTEARAVCSAVDEEIAAIDTVSESVSTAFDAVRSATRRNTQVAAREVSLDPFLNELRAIKSFVEQSTTATRNAITAYVDGDLEMATQFQEEAGHLE